MEKLYKDGYMEITESNIEGCLEIDIKKNFRDINSFNQAIRALKYHIITTGASKMIYILDKVDNIPNIKILEEDFYSLIVRYGVKKIAIVTGKELGNHAYHFNLYGTLKPMAENLGLDSHLFFDLDNARIWVANGE